MITGTFFGKCNYIAYIHSRLKLGHYLSHQHNGTGLSLIKSPDWFRKGGQAQTSTRPEL
jgi:hypothetical protein